MTVPKYREPPDPMMIVIGRLEAIEAALASGRPGMAHEMLLRLIDALSRERAA